MKKVTDQELEKLQQFVNTINEAQATIGLKKNTVM
jgi:hypothetical protein